MCTGWLYFSPAPVPEHILDNFDVYMKQVAQPHVWTAIALDLMLHSISRAAALCFQVLGAIGRKVLDRSWKCFGDKLDSSSMLPSLPCWNWFLGRSIIELDTVCDDLVSY